LNEAQTPLEKLFDGKKISEIEISELLAMREVQIGIIVACVLLLGIILLIVLGSRRKKKRGNELQEASNSINHIYDNGKVLTVMSQAAGSTASYGAANSAVSNSEVTVQPYGNGRQSEETIQPYGHRNDSEETQQPYGHDAEETIQPYSDDGEETIQPYGDDSEETINPYGGEETLPPAWEPPAVIRFVVDTKEEKAFETEVSFSDTMVIGRREDCELHLTPKYISRLHLELCKTPQGIFIRNLSSEKSSRYTLLNHAELDEEERKLEDGDVIEISRTRIEIHIESE